MTNKGILLDGIIIAKQTFAASPRVIYNILLDQKKHSAFTGSPAIIENKVGGRFSFFEGYMTGAILELEENHKIVLAMQFDEPGWHENHYSICTFELIPVRKVTTISMLHTKVPNHLLEDLKKGWKTYYWHPLKLYLINHS